MPDSPMDADELRRQLEAATPKARGIAAALVRRMREPRPTADDIVNAAVLRVINRVRNNPDAEPITNVEAYLVQSLRSVVLDLVDRQAHEPQLPGQLPPVAAPAPTPVRTDREIGFDCAFAKLDQREQCVLTRVHLGDDTVTVPNGFAACGWVTKSPFFEHKKLKDKFKALFQHCVEAAR